MLPFYSKVEGLTQSRVTGLGLSVFRIFISIILFIEVSKLFYFRHLYFDPIPYLVESELSFSLVLIAWLGVLALGLLLGFKTKAAAIINYVLVLVFFSSFTTLKYHFDSALVGISFLMIIMPVNKRLSIDSLLYKLKTQQSEELKVRQVYYYLPVILVLCLQYFDSFFHKSVSELWQQGLGVWLPASLPDQVYTNQSWLLNQKELILGLGYLVLIFEGAFIFLILVKRVRVWLVLLGIGMHLSIALIFPIPTFGVTYAGVYILLLPISFWEKLAASISKHPIANKLLATKSKSIFNTLGVYRAEQENQQVDTYRESIKAKLMYGLVVYLCFGQVVKIVNSPLVFKLSDATGTSVVRGYLETILLPVAVINSKLLGITENLIYSGFVEGDYEILGVAYTPENGKEVWLPIVEKSGMAAPMHFGRVGVVTVAPGKPEDAYEKLVRISSFWAGKNNISLAKANFVIYSKQVSTQFSWEKDFLNRQLNKPWKQIGNLTWKENKATLTH